MEFSYIASTADNRVIKGKLSANSENAAASMLLDSGYHVLSLREYIPFYDSSKLATRFSHVKATEIIMFTRQLALLLESGTDAITSMELLQAQTTNRALKRILATVTSDVRGGMPLAEAIEKHPSAFPRVYSRLVAVGEKGGSLETVLRRAADYMERIYTVRKNTQNAMIYPVVMLILAIGVIAVLVTFVLPSFTGLYQSFDVELPAATRALIGFTNWANKYGLVILIFMVGIPAAGYLYTRSPDGKYRWGKFTLVMPVFGRINLLNELARCCRSISLLYGSGLPLHEIMTMVVQGTNNKAMELALAGVQQSMIAGAGLSRPMAQEPLFLPLMVQMTAVGEQTGNLDHTLTTVAESYETEADDKTKTMISMITPAATIFIGLLVGFVALALVSSMYSIFGQI
jgi:type IV pilus assembly protein PilC